MKLCGLCLLISATACGFAQTGASPAAVPQAIAPEADAVEAQSAVAGYYNVRSFGALGLGTDDETAAVQSAIDAACKTSPRHPYGGVTLYFPAGFYPLHGLTIRCGNLLLEGAGPGATEFQYNGPQNSGAYPATPSASAYILAYTRGMADGGLRGMTLVGYTSMQPIRGVATDLMVVEGELDSQAVFQDLGLAHVIHDGIHLITPAPAFDPDMMGGARGYATASGVATHGGSGAGMTVDVTADNGRVTKIRIASQGSGYLPGDVVTIAQPGSSGDAKFAVAANSQYVNWFLHQIRWDGIGRYCIHMDGMAPGSGQPFALYGFTWANPISEVAGAWLSAHGYMNGPWTKSTTPWGEGLIGFTGGVGYGAAIYDGRLEGTEPQIPVGPGAEGNLFVNEDPQQPSVTLHLAGSSVGSVTIEHGGYGWTANHYNAVFSGCTKNPVIAWTVASSEFVAAKVTSGGACSSKASVSFVVSGGNTFTAQNIIGFISTKYEVPLIYSTAGEDSFKLDNVQLSGQMGDYLNGRTGALLSAGNLPSTDRFSYGQSQTGWSSQGHSFLVIPEGGVPREGESVRAGDILFHDASDYAARPFGQIGAYRVVTYPLQGYTMLRRRTNLCGNGLTPSGNTWTGCTITQLRAAQVSAGAAVTFPSGGASSGSLDTQVTAVDWSTGVITTAAAGTSASSIDFTPPQWRESQAAAASFPTSPDEIYYQGEVVYNAAPAPGHPIWWSCTTKTCTGGAGWIDGPPYGSLHTKP